MSYSVGLTLYNLSHRRATPDVVDRPPRPRGRLVWLHAPGPDGLRGMVELARRLIAEDELSVVLTSSQPPEAARGVIVQAPPMDSPLESRAFLDHWLPDLILFSDGELRPALLHEAGTRQLPLLMVDARAPALIKGRDGWYPGLVRGALQSFAQILTLDDSAAKAFRKAGATQVQVAGRMEEESAALPYLEAERAALARNMATRPIWLAAAVPEAEEAAVIAAHREALRLSHRLLLILVPQDPARASALADLMESAEGWSVALRATDQEPGAETEVYIPDSASEYGLWYRLAPVTFLGGSLSGSGCARSPLEPAALGSAIIYGPKHGPYGSIFGRLGAARAARMVGSAEDLVQALADLLSPDRAARQAQAAWGVASEGVEVTDQVVTLIRRLIGGLA